MTAIAAQSLRLSSRVLHPASTLIATGLWVGAWVAGAIVTQEDREQAIWLVLAQGLLAFLVIEVLRRTVPPAQSRAGVWVLPVFAMHCALYLGVFNIVPALLSEWRPAVGATLRIPQASISSYIAATWAAGAMLLGVIWGCRLATGLRVGVRQRIRSFATEGRLPWLPNFEVSLAVALGLAVVVLFSTVRYGVRYYVLFESEDLIAALPFWERLLFQGIGPFLPLAPFLAASAIVGAQTPVRRRWGIAALTLLAPFNIAALSVWGMRGPAIISLLLPLALFVYTGRLRWYTTVVPALVLCSLVYAAVTVARLSSLGEQLGLGTKLTKGTAGEVLSAGADSDVLLEKFIADMSYRTSGLEPVAGIVEGQSQGVLRPMAGRVILAGFLQSLPAVIRPADDLPDRIKTAPSYYGWFETGDFVTTQLSELVMDAGPWLVIAPAVIVGMLLGMLDEVLLALGQHPSLQPLLVVRIAWLLMILNAASIGETTVLFVKGTMGYTILVVSFGFVGNTVRKLSRGEVTR